MKNNSGKKFTKTGPGIGKDKAPGAPTVSDYRKAVNSAKYLLDLIVDAMERKRKTSHRALTKNDTLLANGEFTKNYWGLPLCEPEVGEKFEMTADACAGVSPAVDTVRELVDFVLGAIKEK